MKFFKKKSKNFELPGIKKGMKEKDVEKLLGSYRKNIFMDQHSIDSPIGVDGKFLGMKISFYELPSGLYTILFVNGKVSDVKKAEKK